jgi:tetratricopeptide (TPR) repeat protein
MISHRSVYWAFFCAMTVVVFDAFAEKVMVYDEEKGIIFTDKDEQGKVSSLATKKESAAPNRPVAREPQFVVPPSADGKTVDAGIQRGRKKDPADVYFESGLQYFKNGSYADAMKNFTRADSLDPQPRYVLWMGKTMRQTGNFDQLLFLMKRIIDTYPESDVADDALFEIAFCYQINDDYDRAMKTYTRLAEQYPFGTSFSNGENFRDVAAKQRQTMHVEMVSTLNLLGYTGEDIESLYSAFQSNNTLQVSGIGTRETVRAIKAAHVKLIAKQNADAAYRERMKKYAGLGWILAGILLINCVAVIAFNRNIAAKRRHLTTLEQTLSDLKTGAL